MSKERSVTLMLRVKVGEVFRYVPSAVSANGRVKPLTGIVAGKAEHHPEGTYCLRYRVGGKRVYEAVGKDGATAVTAKLKREHLLKGEALGLTNLTLSPSVRQDKPVGAVLICDAISEYLSIIEVRNAKRTLLAYRRSLKLFLDSCTKKHLHEVDRSDAFHYMAHLKGLGNGARTVFNRSRDVAAFFRHFGLPDVVQRKDVPRFTAKLVASYSKREIRAIFEACTPEERVLFQFFLGSGAREQEVMYASWCDIDWDSGLFNIRAKADLGWTLKDHEERSVPLPDSLLAELRLRKLARPLDRFLFPTKLGKPDGHMLRKLKKVAKRAGLNCGHCRSKRGVSCSDAPSCRNFDLHKWRKTMAGLHHESGISMRTLQDYLGHSDLLTTQAYLAAVDARSEKTRLAVNKSFADL